MIDPAIRAAEMLHMLSDCRRLMILLDLVENGPATLHALSERLSVPVKGLIKEITRLSAVGLVRMTDQQVEAHLGVAETLAHELAAGSELLARIGESSRLRAYVSWGRLTAIPTDFDLRRELASVLASFIPDEGVAESWLNEVLGRYYHDHAELRRLMVDLGAATRDNRTQTYYRAAGQPGDLAQAGTR